MDECIAGRHDAIAPRRSEALSQAKPCQGRTLWRPRSGVQRCPVAVCLADGLVGKVGSVLEAVMNRVPGGSSSKTSSTSVLGAPSAASATRLLMRKLQQRLGCQIWVPNFIMGNRKEIKRESKTWILSQVTNLKSSLRIWDNFPNSDSAQVVWFTPHVLGRTSPPSNHQPLWGEHMLRHFLGRVLLKPGVLRSRSSSSAASLFVRMNHQSLGQTHRRYA